MGTIGYGYGSEWHLLRYLGYHRTELSRFVLDLTHGDALEWLDVPFATTNERLHDEQEWLRLDFLHTGAVQQQWSQFWPATGKQHHWDAVGKLHIAGQQEWLLVEAKAHVGELISTCGAQSPTSRARIRAAFEATRNTCNATAIPVERWFTPYYQYCNRLVALHFLLYECRPAIPARLLHIYFCGEAIQGRECPANADGWKKPLQDLYQTIGVDQHTNLMKRVHHLFLSVNPNAKGRRIAVP